MQLTVLYAGRREKEWETLKLDELPKKPYLFSCTFIHVFQMIQSFPIFMALWGTIEFRCGLSGRSLIILCEQNEQ